MADEYTVTINELLKDTLPELPGIVRSVATREFRMTLRDFFEKTYAWTATVKDIAISTGETPIQLSDGDSNTEVIAVLHVAKGNTVDGFTDMVPLAGRPTSRGDGDSAEFPSHWFITSNPDELVLHPYLDVATSDTLTVKVALIPAFAIDPAAETLPRQILLKYYDAIMDGFLARVYAHPNKPYSAPLSATDHRKRYSAAMGFYTAQRKKGYNGTPNWRYPGGWRVSKPRP